MIKRINSGKIVFIFILGGILVTGCKKKSSTQPEPENHPPTITDLVAPDTICLAATCTLSVTATDPDGDPITYSWNSSARYTRDDGDFSDPADSIVHWTSPAFPQPYYITVIVSDDNGAKDTAKTTIRVLMDKYPSWQLAYSTDFSSDPGWVSSNPSAAYWDSTSETFVFDGYSNQGDAYREIQDYQGKDFKLMWNTKVDEGILIASPQMYANLNFGISKKTHCSGDYVETTMKITWNYSQTDTLHGLEFGVGVEGGGGGGYGPSDVGWLLNKWYTFAFACYHEANDSLLTVFEVLDDAGEQVQPYVQKGIQWSSQPNKIILNSWKIKGEIDNVQLYVRE